MRRRNSNPLAGGRFDVDPHVLADAVAERLRQNRCLPPAAQKSFKEIREEVLTEHCITSQARPLYRSAIGFILGSRPKRKRISQRPVVIQGHKEFPLPDDDSWFIVVVDREHIVVCSGQDWEFDCTIEEEKILLQLKCPDDCDIRNVPEAIRDRVRAIARGYFKYFAAPDDLLKRTGGLSQ